MERALKHFGPVLGDARKKSKLKSTPQEIVFGREVHDLARRRPEASRGARPAASTFPQAKTFALFEPGPDSDTSPEGLERTATHEFAHGTVRPTAEGLHDG